MASIKKCLEQFTGQDQAREDAKRQIASLVQLANAKLDALEAQMKDMFRNKELEGQIQIVGDRMGAFAREYRVNYTDGDVSDAVDSLIDQIMDIGSKDAANIISKAIKNGINAMFASASAQEENKRMFVVLLEGVAMVRYDFWIWKSSEQDHALFSHAENIVAITYARSVVDHRKLSDDELNDGIYRCLGGPGLDEIIAYKKKLLELFGLKMDDGPSANAPEGQAALSAEELDRQLTSKLMEMLKNTPQQTDAPMLVKAAVPNPEIWELSTMDTGKYRAR